MPQISEYSEADFRDNPVLFVELAQQWAMGGSSPDERHSLWLQRLPRPLFARPAEARAALWGILSTPERARSLTWLDRAGILEELIPVWGGDYFRQALRLQAVEQVHLEKWAEGLSKISFEWLCVYQDQRVDGQLGGWAVTGLATLLLAGDEPAESFARRVESDLKALGAGSGERERVTSAIREHGDLLETFLSGLSPTRSFSPTTIVATLSTLLVIPHLKPEIYPVAMACADKLIKRFAAPEDGLETKSTARKK